MHTFVHFVMCRPAGVSVSVKASILWVNVFDVACWWQNRWTSSRTLLCRCLLTWRTRMSTFQSGWIILMDPTSSRLVSHLDHPYGPDQLQASVTPGLGPGCCYNWMTYGVMLHLDEVQASVTPGLGSGCCYSWTRCRLVSPGKGLG